MKYLNDVMKFITCSLAIALYILMIYSPIQAQDSTLNLKNLSIEDLINIEIVSVSKKSEKLSEAAAAIFVITSDDIKGSGFKSIPEVLRLAPGIHVARVDGNKWAISSRGFNESFANKLLVLIDGRSVYTPLFSGVYWDIQDVILEDVDRIEIIRGPGATLWGANAVNGVINIITKNASETVGYYVKTGYEIDDYIRGALRVGFKLGNKSFLRIYSKYTDFNGYNKIDDSKMNDQLHIARGGFRLDWQKSDDENVFARGEYYHGKTGQTYNSFLLVPPYSDVVEEDTDLHGANIVGRWTKQLSTTSGIVSQFYLDYSSRQDGYIFEKRSNVNLYLQFHTEPTNRIGLVVGLGYRRTQDKTVNTTRILLDPLERTGYLYNAFIQTDISLLPNELKLIFGSKFEHNDYTGYEIQPSGRVLWKPHPKHTLWAAISKAIRTPSRAEHSIILKAGVIPPSTEMPFPTLLRYIGEEEYGSESLVSFETGYRTIPAINISFDIALFYNKYSDLRSLTFNNAPTMVGNPPDYDYAQMDMFARNEIDANAYGFEVVANWILSDEATIKTTYSNFTLDITSNSRISQSEHVIAEGVDPKNQFGLNAIIDPCTKVRFDIGIRYVGELPFYDIDDYLTTDLRIQYQINDNIEIDFGGHNLTGPSHIEFESSLSSIRGMIEQSLYGTVTWRF